LIRRRLGAMLASIDIALALASPIRPCLLFSEAISKHTEVALAISAKANESGQLPPSSREW
jgi:hypothetical protein